MLQSVEMLRKGTREERKARMNETVMETVAGLNFDAITLEDAKLLYYEDKRLLINDSHVVGILRVSRDWEV